MVRVAAELHDALSLILQAGPADSPAVRKLIESYRDIARELGQQHDLEGALRDLMSPSRGAAVLGPSDPSRK